MNPGILTMDIDSTAIKYAYYVAHRTRGALLRPKIKDIVPIPSHMMDSGVITKQNELGAILKKSLKTSKVYTRNALLAINTPRLIVRCLGLPPLPLSQLKTMLSFELLKYVPYNPEDSEFDLISLRYTEKEHTVILAAAPKQLIHSLVATCESAGLYPFIIEPGILSLYRWIQYIAGTEQPNILLLDIRASFTNILVTVNQLFIVRTVQTAVGHGEASLKLYEEIKRSVDYLYTLSHNKPSRLYIYAHPNQNIDHLGPHLYKMLGLTDNNQSLPQKAESDTRWGTNGGLILGWGNNLHASKIFSAPT